MTRRRVNVQKSRPCPQCGAIIHTADIIEWGRYVRTAMIQCPNIECDYREVRQFVPKHTQQEAS